jgi:hypothetical protein
MKTAVMVNYGLPNDLPVVGDWDGKGSDTIGIFRQGQFFLRNSNSSRYSDVDFLFGITGDQPLAGTWEW